MATHRYTQITDTLKQTQLMDIKTRTNHGTQHTNYGQTNTHKIWTHNHTQIVDTQTHTKKGHKQCINHGHTTTHNSWTHIIYGRTKHAYAHKPHGHTNTHTQNHGHSTTHAGQFMEPALTHGMRKIRHKAAATEAQSVFAPTGRFLVESYDSIRANTPVLAAVSPNRDIGPWISAGPTPR